MADDWGWSDIAACRRYQGLKDPIPTPNLDRLVAEGMMFTDAHSPAALCAPSRFSMMTGSNPYRNGVQWGTWGLEADCAFSVNRRHITVGQVMQTAGYRTAFFGKMHFGGGSTNFVSMMPEFPTTYGFDYTFCTHGGIQDSPYLYFENDRFARIDPADPLNPSEPGTWSDIKDWTGGNYTITNGTGTIQADPHDGLGDVNWNSSQNGIINSKKAARFIRNHHADYPDRPFMMYYCAPQVHVPHTPPIDFEPDDAGVPGSPPNAPVAGVTGGDELADMVYELDLQVGRIIAALEDPNGDGDSSDSILADTLVMFTSDNGGLASERGIEGYDSTGILRGNKAMIEEGGHRVPFIARWGDGTESGSAVAPGMVSRQLICTHDWVGAMYALTGQSMVDNQAMDCANILPVLLGEQDESVPVHEYLLHQSQNTRAYPYAIRKGDYVLFIDATRSAAGELYNLADDLTQSTNLLEGTPSQDILDIETELLTLFRQHDQAGEARTTVAYSVPDIYPPTPNPARFSVVPTVSGSSGVTMTAETGIDPSSPVEYLFTETSGNWGGGSSGWQTSPVYAATGLLQDLTYSYTVTLRDSAGHSGTSSSEYSVTVRTPSVFGMVPFFTDDFSLLPSLAPGNSVPVEETWFLPLDPIGASPQSVDETSDSSVNVVDGQLKLGFGGDRVSVRWYSDRFYDLHQEYCLSGDWVVDTVWSDEQYTSNERGFRAGLGRFSRAGEIIGEGDSRAAPDLQFIKWVHIDPDSPAVGDSGSFSLKITASDLAAAGVASTDRVGIVLYRNSDNWPTAGGANDMYRVDNLALGIADDDSDGLPNTFEAAHGLNPDDPGDASVDTDGDGSTNLQEYFEGTDLNDPADVLLPVLAVENAGLHRIDLPSFITGRRYRLEFTEDILSGAWLTVAAYTPLIDGENYFFEHTTEEATGFYRIRTERIP
ncbi:MAG: sulfatase-like hydrolase/transferase, partial [Kiritimatiellales bacterium]